MGVSTKETISIGLAHEFMMVLTRRGVTKEMIAGIVSSPQKAHEVSTLIKGGLCVTTVTEQMQFEEGSLPVSQVEWFPHGIPGPSGKIGQRVRTINLLKRHGMLTLGDIAKKRRDDLLNIKNLGGETLGEIERILSLHGMSLRD